MTVVNSIKLTILAAVLCLPVVGTAQTAKWVIRPNYDEVQRMDHEYFKVRQGDKYGVFSSIGFQLVPFNCDSITDFVDGYAYAIKIDKKGRKRIMSIISSEQTVRDVEGEFYLTDDYPFFTRDMMPVRDKNGKYGYINYQGQVSISPRFEHAKPFCREELAAVVTGKLKKSKVKTVPEIAQSIVPKLQRVAYVNLRGQELELAPELGELIFGSTFRDGEAMVITAEGDMCTINTEGQRVRDCAPRDYLAFDRQGMVIWPNEMEDTMYSTLTWPEDGPTPFLEDGLYGYRVGTRQIVPPQFRRAWPFSAGYAIVMGSEGKYGVLGLGSESVRCEKKKGTLANSDVTMEAVDYTVTIPKELEQAIIEMKFIYEEGPDDSNKSYSNGLKRDFAFVHPRGKRVAQIFADDLLVQEAFFESKKVKAPTPKPEQRTAQNGRVTKYEVDTSGVRVIRDNDDNGKKNTGSTTTKKPTTTSTKKPTTTTPQPAASPSNVTIAVSGGVNALKADSNDRAAFTVVIYNRGNTALSTPVMVTGKGVVYSPHSVNIAPNGTAQVVVTFTSVKAKESRTFTVKTNYKSLTGTISLSPFFVEF